MRKCAVVAAVGAVAVLSSRLEAAITVESHWFRWPAVGGVVQHIIANESDESSEVSVSSRLGESCDASARLSSPSDDKRFTRGVSVDLKPRAWVAIWTPIPERGTSCKVDLFRLEENEKVNVVTSTELTPGVTFFEALPYEKGEVHIDTSVVVDDLLHAFEPQGTNLQVQLRVRNVSSDVRMFSITRRSLQCGRDARFDWVLGPGEAPVQISSGPTVVEPGLSVVFSQRLRGSGKFTECAASFAIAEARRPYKAKQVEHEEPPVWVSIKDVTVRLSPVAEAYYR